jgi:hypothetical protein
MTLNMSNTFYNVDSKNSIIQQVKSLLLHDTHFTKLIMLEIPHCKVRNYFFSQNYFSKHSSHQKKFLIKFLHACVGEIIHVSVGFKALSTICTYLKFKRPKTRIRIKTETPGSSNVK